MMNWLRERLTTVDVGMDLGTNNVVVSVGGQVVVDVPSVVSMVKTSRGDEWLIEAIGDEAQHLLMPTTENQKIVYPIRDGVVADTEVTEELVRRCLSKARKARGLTGPRVALAVPSDSSTFARKTLCDIVEGAGARKVYLVKVPLASALGAGLSIDTAACSMIVHVGASQTEVAMVAQGSVIASRSINEGSNKMNISILDHVRNRENLVISISQAEDLKKNIGSAVVIGDVPQWVQVVHGFSDGLPKMLQIDDHLVSESLQVVVGQIINAVGAVLSSATPDMAASLIEHGMVLTGGGSLLSNITQALRLATGLPAICANNPRHCVALGLNKIIDDLKSYEHLLLDV